MAEDSVSEEYKEITLADLVRTMYRRKVAMIAVFLMVLLAGVSYTVFATPQYEAQATVIPIDNQDIIKNWLESRQGADYVVADMGERLLIGLFPGKWDAATETWEGATPTPVEGASALLGHVNVRVASATVNAAVQQERLVTLTVELQDPALAAEIANSYIEGLDVLRPVFEDLYQDQVFQQYYDGSNPEQARQQAEVAAKERDYWLVLDHAVVPSSPSSPNVMLNIALSVVLGGLLGVFSVFLLEWISGFRAEGRSVAPPQTESASAKESGKFGYRGTNRR